MTQNHEINQSAFFKRVLKSAFDKSRLKSALIKYGRGIFLESSEFNYINFNQRI
jgi:hypothetical protein